MPFPADDVRFERLERVGVLLVQQESNSFSVSPGSLDRFTIHLGASADLRLAGANSEFAGACDELRRRDAIVVPLLYAHALPAGPLDATSYAELIELVSETLQSAGHLDGLVVCLHGALAGPGDIAGDVGIMTAIREHVGRQLPIALSLDLHANATERLCALATVVTGYKTNPHVDQAATGRRAAAMLCAVMIGLLRPTTSLVKCPALFADESLRISTGILGEVLAEQLATAPRSLVDVSVLPTQPWLDAPDIGFATFVVTDDDQRGADQLARSITRAVWDRRHEFVVDRLLPPDVALAVATASDVRPFIITESADAPTAGASGDGPAMLHALSDWDEGTVLLTIVDRAAVDACHRLGVGATVALPVGASIDARWSPPVLLRGEVFSLGHGEYRLSGVGYNGMTVSMGRFAVVRRGGVNVVISELPAWSADPATWRHAGFDPYDVDILIVRSCTDYIANFPSSAATAVVADVPGAATPRLSRLTFERCGTLPFPIDPMATY